MDKCQIDWMQLAGFEMKQKAMIQEALNAIGYEKAFVTFSTYATVTINIPLRGIVKMPPDAQAEPLSGMAIDLPRAEETLTENQPADHQSA